MIVIAFFALLAFVLRSTLGRGVSEKDKELMASSYAVSLTIKDFDDALRLVPEDTKILMEFYATWCPHCRVFKPEYDKVAKLLNSEPRKAPKVYVARVDCAAEGKVCDRYSIRKYPTMLFGSVAEFMAEDAKEREKIPEVESDHTAASVIKWLNGKLGASFDLKDLPEATHVESHTAAEVLQDIRHQKEELAKAQQEAQVQLQQEKEKEKERVHTAEEIAAAKSAAAGIEVQQQGAAAVATKVQQMQQQQVQARAGAAGTQEKKAEGAAQGAAVPYTYNPKEGIMPDVEGAIVMAVHQIFQRRMFRTASSRTVFEAFGEIIRREHPSSRCREGMDALLTHLDFFWEAEEADDDNPALPPHPALFVCSGVWHPKTAPSGSKFRRGPSDIEASGHVRWNACRGSRPDRRGYPCGLWTMFHALSADVASDGADTKEVGASLLSVIRAFVANFFTCRTCAEHFEAECQKPENGLSRVSTPRQAVMWLWRTHNVVNKRLAGEEAEKGHVEPRHPKVQWPTRDLCAKCWGPNGEWNEREVYRFVMQHYGRYARGHHAEKSKMAKSEKGGWFVHSKSRRYEEEGVDDSTQGYLRGLHKRKNLATTGGRAVNSREASNPVARFLGGLIYLVFKIFLYLFFGLMVVLAVLSCVLAPGGRGQQNKLRAFVRRKLALHVSAFMRKMKGKQGKMDDGLHWP